MNLQHDRFIIRPVLPGEDAQVLEVYRQCEDFLALGPQAVASLEMVETDLKNSAEMGSYFCAVINPQGEWLGVLDVLIQAEGRLDCAFLELLMLTHANRGAGLGKTILHELEKYLFGCGVRELRLGVQENNPAAVRFWQRSGFEITGQAVRQPDTTVAMPMRKYLLREDQYWTIQFEKVEDIPGIHAVEAAAFGREAEANVVDAIRADGAVICSLAAVENGQVVGHVLFSPGRLEPEDKNIRVAALAPVAIHPDFQRRGIGSALIRSGLEFCRHQGWTVSMVLGNPAYYQRFGYVSCANFGIRSEFDVADIYFMIQELVPGVLSGKSGKLFYHPEFQKC